MHDSSSMLVHVCMYIHLVHTYSMVCSMYAITCIRTFVRAYVIKICANSFHMSECVGGPHVILYTYSLSLPDTPLSPSVRARTYVCSPLIGFGLYAHQQGVTGR